MFITICTEIDLSHTHDMNLTLPRIQIHLYKSTNRNPGVKVFQRFF